MIAHLVSRGVPLQLTDPSDIRARLERDRIWAAFSIADLDQPYASHARWYRLPGSDALVLVYGAFDPPIVYLQGAGADCSRILADADVRARTARAWLNVLPSHDDAVREHFASFEARRMVRMVLERQRFRPVSADGVCRLGSADLDELHALYADDRPAFFMPSQLVDGVYYAVRMEGRLVSVAGTHVVSRAGAVGAIGNVYTSPTHRGRGLAAAVTSAVTMELLDAGITTIVLNIVVPNVAARRVYERLGFVEDLRVLGRTGGKGHGTRDKG
ncbi:MAG: GNAT family N-acetyltransferase [Vicinamibacterales bacterium]